MKASIYLYLVFLCIFRVPHSVFLDGVYPVLVILRVSLSFAHFNLTLSLDGVWLYTIVLYLLALYLLVIVVTFFTVLRTIGNFSGGGFMYYKFIH